MVTWPFVLQVQCLISQVNYIRFSIVGSQMGYMHCQVYDLECLCQPAVELVAQCCYFAPFPSVAAPMLHALLPLPVMDYFSVDHMIFDFNTISLFLLRHHCKIMRSFSVL